MGTAVSFAVTAVLFYVYTAIILFKDKFPIHYKTFKKRKNGVYL